MALGTVARPAPARQAPVGLGPLRRGVREVGLGLITAGVIILLFVAYQLFGTNLTEARNQAQLKKAFNHALLVHRAAPSASAGPTAGGTATGPGDPSTLGGPPSISTPGGGAIDHMVIPKIGLDKFVVDGVSEADLSRGPGHYPGTAYPGAAGNAAIAGHRTTYGAPFYRLNELAIGDDIYFTDINGHEYRYQVDRPAIVVAPSDVAVLRPTPDARLTLTTCNPRFTASNRLIVTARLIGLPAPAPPAPVTAAAVTPAPPTNLTAGNHSALPPALLYGAGVAGLWIATRLAINRTRRWARAGSYLGGIAVSCIPLWFCFENVVRLLPQSI